MRRRPGQLRDDAMVDAVAAIVAATALKRWQATRMRSVGQGQNGKAHPAVKSERTEK